MTEFTFVSGNEHKIRYLEMWLGRKVNHQKFDLAEIQSLDLREVVEHKVKEAYAQFRKPVLVEDIALEFSVFGRLPGTYIKWFLEECGTAGLARMLDGYSDRSATVKIMYGLYGGREVHYFAHATRGTIADKPRSEHSTNAHGWNTIFIPDGTTQVLAEIPGDRIKPYSYRYKAIQKLKRYLNEEQGSH